MYTTGTHLETDGKLKHLRSYRGEATICRWPHGIREKLIVIDFKGVANGDLPERTKGYIYPVEGEKKEGAYVPT